MYQNKNLFIRKVLSCILFAAVIGVAVVGCTAAPAQSFKGAPLILGDQVTLGNANIVAVNPNGRRLYLGDRYNTDPNRLNLVVCVLNDRGEISGEPRYYRDSVLPLPSQARTSITAITPDARHKKLFVAYALDGVGAGDEKRNISVYDLDDNGEPVGEARAYISGNPAKAVGDMAVNPQKNVLYIVGWGGAAVYAYELNDKGEPQGEPKAFPIGGQGKYEVSVSPDGKRLYLGTYPDLLEVVDLDENGFPTGKPRTFKAGDEKTYLHFGYSTRALFFQRSTPNGSRLAVWPLNTDGDPVGEPQVHADLPVSTLAVDESQNKLWIGRDDTFQDAFSGKTIVQGVRPQSFVINADSSLGTIESTFPSGFREQGVAMAANNGRVVLITSAMPRGLLGNRVKDYRVRVTLLAAKLDTGATPPKVALKFSNFNGSNPLVLGEIVVGETTSWNNLDAILKDRQGALVVSFSGPANLTQLQLRVEIAQGDPAAGGKLLQTMTDDVQGNVILALLPGYGFDPPQQREAAIELFSEHAQKYLDTARTVALKPDERPRLFNISATQLLGGQGSFVQLQREAEAVSLLGFNTINAYWWGSIPPEKINTVLNGFGLQRRTSAIYNPPSYFAYNTEKMNSEALEKWAQQFPVNVAKTNGGTSVDVVTHYLADEPGWYYPGLFDALSKNPQWLENFRAYLREQGLKPGDLGQTSWDKVFPLGASEGAKAGASLENRRLFYWTARFFPESAAKGFRLATDAIRKIYGHDVDTPVNWNNWLNNWYNPSPNAKIANNDIIGPDSAEGSMDWFESGRQSSNTLWTEDWFGDSNAQNWSLYSDMLRSASMLGQSRFGGYVIGASVGAFPAGAKYKILSLLGHGGKSLDMFTFGPEPLFPGNCWSENFGAYGPIASAMRLVGRSERLLYPGKPARGKVAILVPSTSRLWEQQQRETFYQSELYGLHAALIHTGYTVDFVDGKDLSGDDWSKRGYATLYITGPNIEATAQEKIVAWVRGGGTLVATPGAGVADEYNTPTTLLDAVLGVQGRVAVRDAAGAAKLPTDHLLANDPRFAVALLELKGPVAKLQTTTATALATLQGGGAAIAGNQFGKGRGIAYSFFPGWQYWNSPDRSSGARLPQDWSAADRNLVVAPVQIANTPRPVIVSEEGVEAVQLQSEKGVAVTLLNWKGDSISTLTVTVVNPGKFRNVSTASGAIVKSTFKDGSLTVTLPLKDVDVLMIE